MNEIKPIWLRNPKDVTDKEYEDFYKAFSKVNLDCQVCAASINFCDIVGL